MKGLLLLATCTTQLIQSLIQMTAIVMGLKVCVNNSSRTKPARECVTFLTVANISLWLLSLFSDIVAQEYELQTLFIGQFWWQHFITIVDPILKFYYLFSASCLIKIWYTVYRIPLLPITYI